MPIITISRGTMSGGAALAERLSERLGIPTLGREANEEVAAAKIGVSPGLLSQKLEQTPGVWERLTADRRRFLVAAQLALAERAAGGDVIYHGLAGHLLLRDVPTVLRVRLIAPLVARLANLVEQHGMRVEAAEAYIRQVDEERAAWTRLMFGENIHDPALYDVVLNLGRVTLDSACEIVVAAAARPEFEVTGPVRLALQAYVLASRVKLALATEAATRMLDLQVAAEGGRVTVRGVAPETPMLTHKSERLEREVETVARGVEGVEEVTVEISRFGVPLS